MSKLSSMLLLDDTLKIFDVIPLRFLKVFLIPEPFRLYKAMPIIIGIAKGAKMYPKALDGFSILSA